MPGHGDAIVARARALVGVRFRPQGRSIEGGLDCIGVVTVATGIARERVPDDYPLRGGNIDRIAGELAALGFSALPPDQAEPGDVVIANSGPDQLHAVVLTPAGYVQAHAGLRRVVETPGTVRWPILAAWRAPALEG